MRLLARLVAATRSPWTPCLCAVLAIGACSSPEDEQPAGTACVAPEDCLPGQRCTNGICVAAGEGPGTPDGGSHGGDAGTRDGGGDTGGGVDCVVHRDCGAAHVCVAGSCEPGDCLLDGDCEADHRCTAEHTCAPAPECEDDDGCPEGQRCSEQRCVPVGPQCPEDADCDGLGCGPDPVCGTSCGGCTPPDTCTAGVCGCTPACGAAECGPDPVCGQPCGMCAEDEHCQGGRCVCRPDCQQRACGLDPNCGQACGVCADDEQCDELGRCQPVGAGHPCDEATLLQDLGEQVGSNAGAAALEQGSCGGAGGAEVAYRFVPSEDGRLRISTAGTAYDTVLYVRQRCREPDSELGCNDDTDPGLQSELTVDVLAGVELWIFVDAYGPREQGELRLDVAWDVAPQCPQDADCAALQCGPDPVCGVSCGECADDQACLAGQCEGCAPACGERACGPDPVCGASCGECAPELQCVDGACVACVPACDGRECGPDPACGASCGECGEQRHCEEGLCRLDDGVHACDAAAGIERFGAHPGTTGGGPSLEQGTCGGRGAEAVWAFALNADACLRLSTEGSALDTVLYVRTACEDSASEVVCNDDAVGLQSAVEVEAVAEQVYWVYVDGFAAGAEGDYSLTVSLCEELDCPADADCGARECGAEPVCATSCGDCPAEEECLDGFCSPDGLAHSCTEAELLDSFGTYAGTTTDAAASERGGCGGRGREQVFVFLVDTPTCVLLSTEGSDFDTVLHVREGDCLAADAEVGCDDDVFDELWSEVELDVLPDLPYWVFVDAFAAGRGGDYELTIGPCP